MLRFCLLLLPVAAALCSCQDSNPNNTGPSSRDASSAESAESVDPRVTPSRLIGRDGIAAWDALSVAEKSSVTRGFQSFFLHQSVGGDLVDGAEGVGYPFEYAESGATDLKPGLNEGLFHASNGQPVEKIAEFRAMALANRSTVRVAIMKFGYADIDDGLMPRAQAAYQEAVQAIKAAGMRVLHVTPTYVYASPAENLPKMRMRAWMLSTFAQDVFFDLGNLETTDPATSARCERGGAWEICQSIRSTTGCPSLWQGIDAPQGQGHLCYDPHAKDFSKAFLYAIYVAGK